MENINLIRKIAWSFHRTTGLEWDDLFQEAALAYLEALRTYNPEKGRITTYMWWCITSRLKDYLREERKYKQPICSIEDVDVDYPTACTPLFESLSNDAQLITDIIQATPKKFIALTPQLAKRRVIKITIRKGWSRTRVWRSIQELKLALN